MQRWKFSRGFKLEAVKLALERVVSAAQAERDILKFVGIVDCLVLVEMSLNRPLNGDRFQ